MVSRRNTAAKYAMVCSLVLLIIAVCTAAYCEVTKLPNRQVLRPLTPAVQEDCIKFNWSTAEAKQVNGSWKVVDGNMWMLDFGTNEAQAKKALAIIKYYKMDSQCFVGRPNAPMQYYLANGKAPEGSMAGEDFIPFNPATTEAKQVNGTWKVVDGAHWMLDFGASETNAKNAVSIIKKYGFGYICFVGRPNAPMMYFKKAAPAVPLQISAKLTANPTKYTGAYPAKIVFKGSITVNAPCTVKYTFTRSDGATGPSYDLMFAAAGTKDVQTDWTIGKDYVGWQAIKVIAPIAVESNKAQFEIKSSPQEDCIKFNWSTAEVKQYGSSWKVVDGNMAMLDFGTNEAQAKKALAVIKYYKMDSQCFVGRPGAPMQYYLVNGKSPDGPMVGEDCIPFNPATTEAKQIGNSWRVVDGNHSMLDFGASETNARTAVSIIKKYGFTFICFVGRPNAPMMYFRKGAATMPLQISAKLTADPAKYTGAYPAKINFKGSITVNAPCTVKYTFTRSDGATGPSYDLKFDAAGTKGVSTDWTISKDYAGWQAIKVTAPIAVESSKAQFEIKSAVQEDCITFSPDRAEAKQVNGSWKIVDGNMWMLDFGTNEANAKKALAIIKQYRMTSQCFVGRPNPPMQYYLVNGNSPVGAFAGEDSISFNPATTEAKLVNGSWKVVDGSHWILDFGSSETKAKNALSIIKKYGFKYICFVGRPNPPMMYFRK